MLPRAWIVSLLHMYRPLPSNMSTCYIAPSLRLFFPNSLQAYRHILFSDGCVCDVCDRPQLPSWWLGSPGNYFPTAPAAPSSKSVVPSGSLINYHSVQVHHHHLFSNWCGQKFQEWLMLLHFWLLICCLFFRFGGGRPLHNIQSLTSLTQWKSRRLASRPPTRESIWRSFLITSRFIDVAAALNLDSVVAFRVLSYSLLDRRSFMKAFFAPCRNSKTGHPSESED
jgi:hypothetical protein